MRLGCLATRTPNHNCRASAKSLTDVHVQSRKAQRLNMPRGHDVKLTRGILTPEKVLEAMPCCLNPSAQRTLRAGRNSSRHAKL